MNTKRKNRRGEESPLTMEEILQRDNIAASEPVPVEIAERLASSRVVLSSDDGRFDPRKHFTKIKGSRGAWELSTKAPVTNGLRVEKMERVKPGSLARAARGARITEAFRPPWQPYIYHPKTIGANFEPRLMKRKSGAKTRPHAVFDRDDRVISFPEGYPWHCIGRVSVNVGGIDKFGTGTLVGSRTVLCSAHQIPWGQLGATTISFAPGYFFTSAAVSVLSTGKATSSFVNEIIGYDVPDRVGWDIAVMRLVDPLGDWLGTFGARTYNDDWEDDPRWTLVGYPAEMGVTITSLFPLVFTSIKLDGQAPTRQFGISVEDDDADGSALELEHYGDSSKGSSGGPLFGHWPDGPYLIGVTHGTVAGVDLGFVTPSRVNIAAGGNAMVDLVRSAREMWV